MIWLSGDSWLDWRSTIKSKCKYDDSLEGLLSKEYTVLNFARGGDSNTRQLDCIDRYINLDVQKPDVWIHAWTELGRGFEKSIDIANRLLYIKNKLNCKLLVFGGQAPIPSDACKLLHKNILIKDWKYELLGQDYGASQYFSVILENKKHNLSKKELQREIKLAEKQLNVLKLSNKFPDNAHPGKNEYLMLYKKIKEIIC